MGVNADEPYLSDEFLHGGFANEGAADDGVLLVKNPLGMCLLQKPVRTGRGWKRLRRDRAFADRFAERLQRTFASPAGRLQSSLRHF